MPKNKKHHKTMAITSNLNLLGDNIHFILLASMSVMFWVQKNRIGTQTNQSLWWVVVFSMNQYSSNISCRL